MTENPQPLTEERLAEMERRAKNAGYAGRSSWSEDVPALVAEVRRLKAEVERLSSGDGF